MQRLELKWQTIRSLVPKAEVASQGQRIGVLFYGTTALPMPEAVDLLQGDGIALDSCRVRAFPFGADVESFVQDHEIVFVVEQNRDAQMRTLLINELQTDPAKLVPVLYYAGLSISADTIYQQISDYFTENKLSRLAEVQS